MIWSKSEGIVLDCIFDTSELYRCNVQTAVLTTSKDCREITKIRGYHLSGKTNDDVKEIGLNNKTINFLPRGITKFFKNMEIIHFYNSNLKEVTKYDLKEFGNRLTRLYLYNSLIEVIESDLFIYNQNLQTIYLANNKIKHIENGAFDRLQKVTRLELQNNPCTSSSDTMSSGDRTKLMTIITSVESKCKDPCYSFLQDKNEKIRMLEDENEKLKEENQKLKQFG